MRLRNYRLNLRGGCGSVLNCFHAAFAHHKGQSGNAFLRNISGTVRALRARDLVAGCRVSRCC
jgi:hypothetical protein